MTEAKIILGDCLAVLPTLPPQSYDLVFTDPPYPCIQRPYGYWTEPQWLGLMMAVIRQVRRVLKPSGSAVFVLQPNSERVGRMRTWLWKFLAWVGEEWGIVQDAYWWNYTTLPRRGGLMRPSVKTCVWLGHPDCYRNAGAVPWRVSNYTVRQALRSAERFNFTGPSGCSINRTAVCEKAVEAGGTMPYNLLPVANSRGHSSAGGRGHGAGTPLPLCSWWLRYLCPPGGAVLDPFAGTSTTGVAALQQGKSYLGIEQMSEYVETSRKRLSAATASVTAS